MGRSIDAIPWSGQPCLMHETPRVLFQIENNVARVILNRPEKHNGLDFQFFKDLRLAAKAIRKNRSVRVVVLSGNGPSFCSGLDFASVGRHPFRIFFFFLRMPWRITNAFQEVIWIWRKLRVPVVAAIHGNCFGGGLQLALAADVRFVAPDAKLSVMEIRWGLIPDMTGTVLLTELLPLDIAKDLLFTGRQVLGTEAKELGLATYLCSDPLSDALRYAEELVKKSPDALGAGKLLLQKNRRSRVGCAFLRERLYQLWMGITPNQRIAMRANFQKSSPQFRNRLF